MRSDTKATVGLIRVTAICYLCGEALTTGNRSQEHLLPNSIGGRLKSDQLLCKTCNETTGQLYDPTFARFANMLASKYNISRERGTVQNEIGIEKETGHQLVIKPGYGIDYLHPVITKVSEHERIITASSVKRHQQAMDQLKKEAGHEGREIDFTPTRIDRTPRQVNFIVNFAVNQDAVLRSVCKTLCSFYYRETNDRAGIEPLIDFLTNEIDNTFAWFCDLNLIHTQHPGHPYHLVIIKGDKKKKALYGYFEIFGEKGFISLMNGRYTGDDLLISYTYDVIHHLEVQADYTFEINIGQLIQHILAKPQL